MKQFLAFFMAIGFCGCIALVVIWQISEHNHKAPKRPTPIVVNPPITPIPDIKEATYEEALDSIKEADLKKDLYYLASDELEGRMSGKQGNVMAAAFIKKQYESFGLETAYQKFNIRRLNPGPKNETGDDFTQNVIAWIEGNDPILKNEIIVIGAHMDHIGYGPSMSRAPSRRAIHPGADDNASGTVALMQIARAFSMLKGKIKRTVVFQSYSAEEMGLIGSRYYCDHPLFPKENPSIRSHVFMLNMDMVGYLNKRASFSFESADSSVDVGKIITELNKKYTFAKKITSRGTGGSDHASFYNKRVPIAFLHTGLHPYYHTPDDTADKINYNGIEQIAKYAFELAYRVANDGETPKFNNETFRAMEYTHDHGDVPFEHEHGGVPHNHGRDNQN